MNVSVPTNERKSTPDPVLSALLATDAATKLPGFENLLRSEWDRVRTVSFNDLPKVTCAETQWPMSAVNDANAFNDKVERDYVIAHVGHASCAITRELAEHLKSLMNDDVTG